MTPEQAKERVNEVWRTANEKYDNEAAHDEEDALYIDVLKAIASGEATDPAELARIALKTQEVGYERWYA